ncbi:DUF6541 family protein [Actinomyces procaprae]|uniref:DUF6541 family protein n=1 Tax=Actinomyces procaprae TaxID=2560010 RepID=UPI00109DF9C9|nr:DUF6541 family protein [Actinomyces procaprae]
MSLLVPWLHCTGYALELLALMFIPGLAMLRVLGYRGLLPVAAAPPVTFAVVAVLGQMYAWIGLGYSLGSLSVGLVVCLALTWCASRLVLGRLPAPLPRELSQRRRGTALLSFFVALGVGVLIALPILRQWDPELPAQQIDSVFHYNLAWTITQTGDASLLSGASWSFSMRAIPAYYPLVWHAIVAAIAGPAHVVAVTNTLVSLTPIVWALGVAALAHEAFPTSRWAPAVASLTMALLPAYPVYMLAYRQLWPNALGYAVLPAMLALLCRAMRLLSVTGVAGRRRATIALGVFAVALLGAIATYPSAVFSVVLTGLPLLYGIVKATVAFVSRRLGSGRTAVLVAAAGAVVLLLVVAMLVLEPGVIARLGRDGYAGLTNLPRRLCALLTLWPLGGAGLGYKMALSLQLVLIVSGLVVTVRRRQWRWITWAWLLPMILLTASYLPLGPLTAATGLWYNDPYRIIPLVMPAISLLAAASVEWLLSVMAVRASDWRVRPVQEATAAACVVLLLAGSIGADSSRGKAAPSAYAAETNALVRTLTVDEVAMIRSLRDRTDPNLMVLGDPAAGAAYVEVLAGLLSVFPHMTFRSMDWDALYLAQHFSEINEDPKVCELVRHYRIGYYYADDAGTVAGMDVPERAPGLYGVDTSSGFELVASARTASVWRITACGDLAPASARDPWGLSTPYEPLYGPDGAVNTFDENGELVPES